MIVGMAMGIEIGNTKGMSVIIKIFGISSTECNAGYPFNQCLQLVPFL